VVACLSPKKQQQRHIEEVDERVDDTLQTTAGEETAAEKEPFYEEYNISSQEVERLLIDVAELERQKAELQSYPLKEPTAGPDDALLLPVVFAGIRMKKCVAAMFSPCRLSLSGWQKRGHPFITPKIDKAIKLAKDLECCHDHHWDNDKPGQFFACHAERQLLMEWLEYMQGEGKVFSCDTSIDVCKHVCMEA
jgi:hypothetical protein